MEKSLIYASETKISGDGLSISAPKDVLFQRRIEFHLARKNFYPYSSNAGRDFRLETLNPSSESQRSASSGGGPLGSAGKKSEGGSDFSEHGLDPELRFEITFRRIGAGLANLGNTCFLNSVLQCLTYTEPFAAYLQSGKHKSSCHTAGFCALCAIQNHVRSALQSTGKILSPFHLVKNLRCISRNFRNSRQEDAHEYMVNLLESMHKCCLPSGVSSESPSAYEKSLVHKIFGGRLRSQVKCMQCCHCSNKFDPFLDLSLEIVKADSLRKALAHFTAVEQLDGGERQYQCQRCKEKVKALKQLTVYKAPYVLTIHLKRFGSDVPGQKIDRRVDFGPSLDLKTFVSGPYEGDLKYTLYGVLVHAGWSTHSGHYYCFVRTSSGLWYSLDDNKVLQVSEKYVLEQKAYMLFYVRDRNSTAPPLKSLDIVSRGSVAANTTGNKELIVSSTGSKKAIQNGQMERSLGASNCASSITKPHAVSFHCQPNSAIDTSLKERVMKKASTLQSSYQVVAEVMPKLVLLEEPMLHPLLKSTLFKKPSVLEAESSPKSVPMAENGVITSIIGNATLATENARTNPRNEHHNNDFHIQGSGKDSSIVVAQQNSCGGPQNASSKKLPTENGMHENGPHMNGRGGPSNGSSKRSSDLKSEKNMVKKLSSQPSGGENGCLHEKSLDQTSGRQNGGIVNEKEPLNLARVEQTGDDYLPAESKPKPKPKPKPKKPVKRPIVRSMHLGPKRLLFASLSIQKKKKHKRSKGHSLANRKFSQKDTREDSTSNDLGMPTSEKDGVVDLILIQRQNQCHHDILKKVNAPLAAKSVNDCNDDSLEMKERGPEERSSPHIAVLATDESLEKSSISAAYQCVVQDKRGSVQHGLMSKLTRALEVPTVVRWDDIESPSSDALGLGDAHNGSIGYVPDEWDEEYDRGKRKKVRKSSHSFSGPNLFQEIAMKRTHMKKMKMTMDQTSAGNQPFRI